jgi:hypothetical protein
MYSLLVVSRSTMSHEITLTDMVAEVGSSRSAGMWVDILCEANKLWQLTVTGRYIAHLEK